MKKNKTAKVKFDLISVVASRLAPHVEPVTRQCVIEGVVVIDIGKPMSREQTYELLLGSELLDEPSDAHAGS